MTALLDNQDELELILRRGDQRTLSAYFSAHSACGHVERDTATAFAKLSVSPCLFPQADQSLEIVLEQGPIASLAFGAIEQACGRKKMEKILWVGNEPLDGQSAIRAAAIVLSEYIRYRLTSEDRYEVPLKEIYDVAGTNKTDLDTTVRSVQNALVDYVTETGDTATLNRAAGFLKALRGDEGADLWTRKIRKIDHTGILGRITGRADQPRIVFE